MAFSNTTLSSAMAKNDRSMVVASATGFAAGNVVVVDGEQMQVTKDYVSGTTVGVIRGQDGTPQIAHLTSAKVVTGLASDFPRMDALRGRPELGFGAGSGSTVTQITSRATGVTIHALTGQITTINTSLAAEAGADFIVTNAYVQPTDVVVVSAQSGIVGAMTDVTVAAVGSGSFTLRVSNNNVAAGTAETGAIVINFVVIKGVAA